MSASLVERHIVAMGGGGFSMELITMEKRIADLPIIKWWQRDSCQTGMPPMMALACISSTGHWQKL